MPSKKKPMPAGTSARADAAKPRKNRAKKTTKPEYDVKMLRPDELLQQVPYLATHEAHKQWMVLKNQKHIAYILIDDKSSMQEIAEKLGSMLRSPYLKKHLKKHSMIIQIKAQKTEAEVESETIWRDCRIG